MKDVLLVLHHLFNWHFFLVLFCLVSLGLTLPDRWIQPFRSVRFNVYLFLSIAVASSVGTFIPQNKPANVALAKFGPSLAKFFQALGFLDIYHTWWFAGLLALMAFDVVACKLRRLPLLVHGPSTKEAAAKVESVEQFFFKSRHRAHVLSDKPVTEVVGNLRAWFRHQRLRFEETEQKISAHSETSALAFFAGRHRLQRWGDFILHISIVMVLAGNLMGAMFGFTEFLPIAERSTLPMKNRPYDVTLNDFSVEYYQGTGAPSLYASNLVVRAKGQVIAKKRIVVNDPLDIDRVRFYQASWGMTYDFRSATLHVAGKDLELHPKEIVQIPRTPLSVRANQFLPSFDIGADDRPTTADFEGQNPALQVDFLEKNNVQARVWLLKNQPEAAYRIVGDRAFPAAPPPFHVVNVDPVLFSGIQVGYDPGAPLFWTGAIILLFGLCTHFYLHQRRLKILVMSKGRKSEVMIGGWNSRAVEDFQAEFSKWVGEIRQTIS